MAKWLLLFFVLVFGANGKRSPLYGGTDGENFSDGQSQGIVRVKIWSGYIVDGIQVQSDQGGEHVWSDPHGTSKGEAKEVVLAYPDEYIYKISGRTGPNPWTSNGLSRLYLHVNNRRTNAQTTFGPFGTHDYSNQTTFDSPEGTVVGFFGYASSTTYFRGIGVYFQDPCDCPTPSPPPSPPPQPLPSPRRPCKGYQWSTTGSSCCCVERESKKHTCCQSSTRECPPLRYGEALPPASPPTEELCPVLGLEDVIRKYYELNMNLL
ncbi:hypothetical protein SELMODRAFT_416970 [Selaginella moellendorffii]|uniref:Jacalin-type lectin domain-containing protein n=1 Tax=Selaginella moellendorffii TaxID=88036 RepID=D8S0Y9_SELML|nr:hypothetical protein SELMODRAFT_416970 [Selaginella moellendorffii]